MSKKKLGRGRPTDYTDELALEICTRIATGESVRSIGRDEKMPNASTIHAWVLDKEDFSKQYARAKDIGAEIEFDELEEIARTEKDVQRARLIVDTRKWALSKKIPKKYGDKLDVTTKDKELPNPLLYAIRHNNRDGEDNQDEQADSGGTGGDVSE